MLSDKVEEDLHNYHNINGNKRGSWMLRGLSTYTIKGQSDKVHFAGCKRQSAPHC